MKRRKHWIAVLALAFMAGCGGQEPLTPPGTPDLGCPGCADAGLPDSGAVAKNPHVPAIRSDRVGFIAINPSWIERAAKTGASWVRGMPEPFMWGAVERSPGVFNWSGPDAMVRAAGKFDMNMMINIWPFATWDQKSCHASKDCVFKNTDPRTGKTFHHWRCQPCSMNGYASYLQKLVERYDGDGVNDMPGLVKPVKHYEILNEPEKRWHDCTWYFGTPKEYVELVKRSRQAVKKACPTCVSVLGGASDAEAATQKYYGEFFKQGGASYIDVANIHYVAEFDHATMNVKPFKKFLASHKVNKPIWVTEAQFKSGTVSIKKQVDQTFAAGAAKIFFVGFKIGYIGDMGGPGFSPEYLEVVKKYRTN